MAHKIGERFTTNHNPSSYVGSTFEIISISPGASYPYTVKIISDTVRPSNVGQTHTWRDDGNGDMKIIKKNSIKNMKEKFVTMFLSEPEKSFRKAEITNGDGMLTDDGQKIFLSWMLKKYGNDFKTEVVDPILSEIKDEK